MVDRKALKRQIRKSWASMDKAISIVEAITKRLRVPEITKRLKELRRHQEQIGKPKPMKCICGMRFREFKTWHPHWRRKHPILNRRYSAVKGKKGEIARGNLMLRMMRAASA